ncbi:hypothetical protein GA0070617_4261 [Micromonospora yangpuensis]|uniref:4-amino-4-deoxy-L-arabinose transferase n=2 Tax=Micromonospora yangpuensis TaxID=683228 RepID=A0A1C6V166_9ACTN|nr:hypothetical protein GA0070617_4261 [Micromonospora yangpuensis]
MITPMSTGVRQQASEVSSDRWSAYRSALPTVLALGVVVAGLGYRVGLVLHGAPPTNSDEATMGLAALHIGQGRHFPVFFYGQAYMGTLEAWLAAPLLALTGPSVLALRLPTLAAYLLLLVLLWRLTWRLTGDRWFGVLVLALLALGSDRAVKNQLIAGGGYPELGPAVAALALLTFGLVAGDTGRRLPRWAAWGFVAGLMIWVDPLLLPYLAAFGVVLAARCWRELRGAAGALLVAAVLAGAAPLLVDSVRAGRNPLAAVLTAGGAGQAAGWVDRLHGGLVLGPPLGMGFCSPGHCAPWQLWWTAAFPVLLVVAAVRAGRTLRRAGDPAVRAAAALWLALLAGAVGTLAAYTVSSAAGLTPVESSRYLSCLLVSLPALLWPVWTAARRPGTRKARRPTGRDTWRPAAIRDAWRPAAVRGVAVVVLGATVGSAAVATVGAVATVPAARAEARRHDRLVATLRDLGVRHVLAPYWTCNRLTFATGEQVVCAVVADDLSPGMDRYRPYRRLVAAATRPAFVAPVGSPVAAALDRHLADPAESAASHPAGRPGEPEGHPAEEPGQGPVGPPGRLRLVEVDGYRIYLKIA